MIIGAFKLLAVYDTLHKTHMVEVPFLGEWDT